MLETISDAIVLGLKKTIFTFFKWVFTGIIANSFWICLAICMGCLILYLGGLKKASRFCTLSFIIYVFLQAIGSAML